jgi:uncharacterized protein (TIGR03067 family)
VVLWLSGCSGEPARPEPKPARKKPDPDKPNDPEPVYRLLTPDETKAELKKLQGTWLHRGEENQGGTGPPNRKLRLFIEDDRLRVRTERVFTTEARIKLFAGRHKALDLKTKDGRVILALYELNGDQLRITFSKPGGDRPTDFVPRPGERREHWKRGRSAEPDPWDEDDD